MNIRLSGALELVYAELHMCGVHLLSSNSCQTRDHLGNLMFRLSLHHHHIHFWSPIYTSLNL